MKQINEMFTIRCLQEKELEAWFDFLSDEIFVNAERSLFKNQWVNDENRDLNGIFAAIDEKGEIASTIRVFLRNVYIDRKSIPTGIIGSVGTKEKYRGMGLITRLFDQCFQYMKEKGVHLSYLLCNDMNVTFYNRVGYEKLPFVQIKSNLSSAKEQYDTPYTIRKMAVGDIESLAGIYHHTSGQYNGAVVRTLYYWKHWVPANDGQIWVAVDCGNRIIAYLNVEEDAKKNTIYIYEYATLPGFERIFDSFIFKLQRESYLNCTTAAYRLMVETEMEAQSISEPCSIMYRLITPFSSDGQKIENTVDLLNLIKGNKEKSQLLLWESDDA